MKLEMLARTQTGQRVLLAGILTPVLLLTFPQVTHGAQPVLQTNIPTFEIKLAADQINTVKNGLVLGTTVVATEQPSIPVVVEQPIVEPQPPVDPLATRKQLLREYLQRKGPKFAPYADVIAEQPHWRKIMAITNAESGFKHGKCNNYWGIGGSKLRCYASIGDGVKDLNRLLSNRLYTGKSLQQMCGVYVQPCTSTWLKNTGAVYNQLSYIP